MKIPDDHKHIELRVEEIQKELDRKDQGRIYVQGIGYLDEPDAQAELAKLIESGPPGVYRVSQDGKLNRRPFRRRRYRDKRRKQVNMDRPPTGT